MRVFCRAFAWAGAFWAAALITAFTFVQAGLADGLPQRQARIGAPDAAASQPFNWTSFYVSGGAGYGLAHTVVDAPTGYPGANINIDGLSADGFVGDLRAGFDYQVPNTPFLVGAFAGYNFGNMKFEASISGIPGAVLSAKLEPTWVVGGRAGLVLPSKTLIYGGLAWQQAEGSLGGIGTGSQTEEAVVYMLGLEQAVLPNMKLGIEYNYAEYSFDVDAGTPVSVDPEVHTIKARLSLSVNLFN
jgi:opacity protein-like surface antigen